MKVEQLYTACLSEMAYYIESDGEAAIIDPLRETKPYLEKLKENKAKLKYVFLTHFHADFVSGQVDLAKATGATIVFGPNANPNYDFHSAKDLERFKIGSLELELLHTPGHTMESSSYVLIDKDGNKPYVFTGDCLFIGDVGRPDLAVKSEMTVEDLAGHLFDSLRNKIMPLPDSITVYPNHGAGSACGKNMSKETFDTLGNQKKVNYALNPELSKADFIKEVTFGLAQPPQYFPENVRMNKQVNKSYQEVLANGTKAIQIDTFASLAAQNDVLVLDTREGKAYKQTGTIPGAWYIGIDGGFAPWVGALLKDINQKILILGDDHRIEEVVTRLSRVGYDNTLGYLEGGFDAWKNSGREISAIGTYSPEETIAELGVNNSKTILDVRKPSEFDAEHVEGIETFPLDTMLSNLTKLDPKQNFILHCQSGYRSLIAASIMKANGFEQVIDVTGGFKALVASGAKTTDFVCTNS